MAAFVSQSIDNAAHGISVKKAMERLKLKDSKDLIPGMEVRLLPHQLIGVSWMVDQERNSPHKGGILADDMGLGKTVQMIATMAINQPTDGDNSRTTLIVVPAALMFQWREEVETKTNGMFEVHVQHGREKIKDPQLLAEKDVVITTYQTLNMDFPVPPDAADSDEGMEYIREKGGPLSRMKFYRIILDEAQFIRNRGTRSSKVVAMLRGKYRWCLTGTPITNTLADIYGYLRFGRFRPWNDWNDFNEYIAKVQLDDPPLAGARAQEVLKPIMLRRTKNATVEGKPILELPPKDVELVFVEFSKDEREIYDGMEKRAQIQINRFIRNNTLFKNHQQVFVLILRLRQLCVHPHLVLENNESFEDSALKMGSASDQELARALRKMGSKWVDIIKKRFMSRALSKSLDYEGDVDEEEALCPKCNDFIMEDSGCILACGHEICVDCKDAMASAPLEVNQEFGNGDEKTNMQIEKEYEVAASKGLRPCPKCKKMQDLTPAAVFPSAAFYPNIDEVRAASRAAKRKPLPPPVKKAKVEILSLSDASSDDDDDSDLPDHEELMKDLSMGKSEGKSSVKGKGKKTVVSDESDDDVLGAKGQRKSVNGRRKGKGKNDEDDETELGKPNEALFNTWRQGGSNVESSAKMQQLVAYLKEWECTGDKTIVFSQWTSMLNLCEQIFARNGIRNLRYDGPMSREAREYTLNQFKQPGGPKVILVSLKCGGVGLNLVSANRVINLDLAWNYATESQAYDRVHRLGQEKEVYVKRLVIKDSIEERMLKLQETKTQLADAALGEGTGQKLHKLSVKQIKDLFGIDRLSKPDEDRYQRRLQPE
ncbi:SNF2 family N-terminal domain-containing protein [Trametes elegans]|nr:SNF2 family N-terminal domain-containing protein [Trametes elegans]